MVPFGRQQLEGFVLKITNNNSQEYELKEIIDIIDEEPVINEEMLELGKYISKKTLSNLISAYQSMLPSALKAKKDFKVNKKYVSYIKKTDKEYIPKNDVQKELLDLIGNDEVLKSSIKSNSLKTLLDKKVLIEIKKETYRLNNNYECEKCNITLNDEQQIVVDTVLGNINIFKPFLLYGVS